MSPGTPDALSLRREVPADYRAVERLTYEAFQTAEVASGTEALLSRLLRGSDGFVPELDVVAEVAGEVVGNIMYTRSRIVGDDEAWETVTFGPLSVAPDHQRRGVGTALVRHTLALATHLGFRAVLIFGNPAYYARFGFRPAADFGITLANGDSFPAFMALPLSGGSLDGVTGTFHNDPAFASVDKAEAAAFNEELRTGSPL
jgi:predicted N-acetyltransferase YhbS